MHRLKSTELERLIRRAVQARENAYAPHSHFAVGASLLTAQGEIVTGCNVENASYSLCLCAERVAAASAVAGGSREWLALAVATAGGATPCGACRQFLSEFSSDLAIVVVDVLDGSHRQVRLGDLLPEAFDASKLPTT